MFLLSNLNYEIERCIECYKVSQSHLFYVNSSFLHQLFFFIILFLPNFVLANPLSSKANEEMFFKNVNIESLAESKQWLSLIHYRNSFIKKNNVSPLSYNSKKDQTLTFSGYNRDPYYELIKTIKIFINNPKEQCNFPARYIFLRDYFNQTKNASRFNLLIPQINCIELNTWLKAISSKSFTLVYIDSFLNNPASMFGHTLLRIDSSHNDALLSYGVQFAALVNGNDLGFWYALKGVSGGYSGYFSIAPYYLSVTQYSEYEHRAMWEYPLNLSKKQQSIFLAHLWELRNIPFNYYYFNENCSRFLEELLAVAFPNQLYQPKLDYWTIPADSLRKIISLIEKSSKNSAKAKPIFRPSSNQTLISRYNNTPVKLKKISTKILNNKKIKLQKDLSNLNNNEKVQVLDLSYELIKIQNKESSKLLHQILVFRSKINQKSKNIVVPIPSPPTLAHKSERLSINTISESGNANSLEFEYRPALHDLLDSFKGYQKGSKLELATFSLRYFPTINNFEIDRFSLLDVISLTPNSAGSSKLSWLGSIKYSDSLFEKDLTNVVNTNIALGKTFSLSENYLSFLGGIRSEDLTIKPLGRILLVSEVLENLRSLFDYSFIINDDNLHSDLILGIDYSLNNNQSIRITGERNFLNKINSLKFGWQFYF
jgi:hypothetical protein